MGCIVITGYCILFGSYRVSEVDDAWTASYVWNLTHKHSTVDSVFGAPSNIRYFGHIHAHFAGFLGDSFSWSKQTFHAFNLAWVAGAALAWLMAAFRLLADRRIAFICVCLIFMLEPFLGAAFKARSDAMAFFLVSWGMCAAVYGRFFGAALITSIGVETHVIGAVGYFWILAFLLVRVQEKKEPKAIAPELGACLAGGILGFLLYRLVHPESLSEILAYLSHSNSAFGHFNAFSAHYFTRAYFRFLPELIFVLCGAGAYFYKKRRLLDLTDPLSTLFWFTILASLVLRRGNFHYVIFFYPPLIMLAVSGFFQTRLFRTAVLCLACYAAVLMGLLAWQNRDVDHEGFDRALTAVAVPDDSTPVVGPTNAWFVLRQRPFYVNFTAMRLGEGAVPAEIYYIKSEYTSPLPECARVVSPIGEPFVFNRTKVEVLRVDASACPKE